MNPTPQMVNNTGVDPNAVMQQGTQRQVTNAQVASQDMATKAREKVAEQEIMARQEMANQEMAARQQELDRMREEREMVRREERRYLAEDRSLQLQKERLRVEAEKARTSGLVDQIEMIGQRTADIDRRWAENQARLTALNGTYELIQGNNAFGPFLEMMGQSDLASGVGAAAVSRALGGLYDDLGEFKPATEPGFLDRAGDWVMDLVGMGDSEEERKMAQAEKSGWEKWSRNVVGALGVQNTEGAARSLEKLLRAGEKATKAEPGSEPYELALKEANEAYAGLVNEGVSEEMLAYVLTTVERQDPSALAGAVTAAGSEEGATPVKKKVVEEKERRVRRLQQAIAGVRRALPGDEGVPGSSRLRIVEKNPEKERLEVIKDSVVRMLRAATEDPNITVGTLVGYYDAMDLETFKSLGSSEERLGRLIEEMGPEQRESLDRIVQKIGDEMAMKVRNAFAGVDMEGDLSRMTLPRALTAANQQATGLGAERANLSVRKEGVLSGMDIMSEGLEDLNAQFGGG